MSVSRNLLLASSAIVCAVSAQAEAAAQTRQFSIEAQPAETAISILGRQGDVQVIAARKITRSIRTNAVRGEMSVGEALDRLLSGTGLAARQLGNGSYAIVTRQPSTTVTSRPVALTRAASLTPVSEMTPVTAAPQVVAEGAMEDAPVQQPEIVVSGFRGSLVRAQDIKRKSINLTESILAEDMAKMPDLNLSESIQRLPGVAISREGGEGRNITLRGFAPDFTRTTLNGMEVPASSDGLDSGGFTINAGRAFDFHIFASELFNRVDVQKTQRASIEEGGIAGTVDLYSAKPFDFSKPQAVISAQGGYNSITRKVDPRVTAMLSDQFADGKVGVLVSAAYSERTVYQEGFGSVRWTSPFVNGDSWADTNPVVSGTPVDCPAADNLDCLWAPRLPRADFFGNNQKRLGLTGSLQFRPTDTLEVSFDGLFSRLENDRLSYNSMEWLLTHGPAGNFVGQTPRSFKIAPDGKQLIAASFDDVTSWYESRHQTSVSKFQQYVASAKWQASDNLKLDVMAGKARDAADREELRFYARSVPHAYSYDFTNSQDVPVLSYGNYDPNNAANFINALTAANRLNKVIKDNFTTKGNLVLEAGNITARTGVAYSRRSDAATVIAEYRVARVGFGYELGWNPSPKTQLEAGLFRGRNFADLTIGDPFTFDNLRADIGAITLGFTRDSLDDTGFPQSGTRIEADVEAYRDDLGSDGDGEVLRASADTAFAFGRNALLLGVRGATLYGEPNVLDAGRRSCSPTHNVPLTTVRNSSWRRCRCMPRRAPAWKACAKWRNGCGARCARSISRSEPGCRRRTSRRSSGGS